MCICKKQFPIVENCHPKFSTARNFVLNIITPICFTAFNVTRRALSKSVELFEFGEFERATQDAHK